MLFFRIPSFIHALLFTVIFLSFACLYGRFHFYRDPGSIFFQPERFLERHYSLDREKEPNSFRDEFMSATNQTAPWKSGPSPALCGIFITVARKTGPRAHPLELSITSALAGLSQAERQDLNLRVYFANTKPSDHPLHNSSLLELVDGVAYSGGGLSEDQVQELVDLETERQFGRKVALDFAYALNYASNSTSSPYIAIFEGDVLFANGWLARSRIALQEVETQFVTAAKGWLDMRLFNEERNIGWASRHILGNNVPIIIIGILSAVFGGLLALRCFTAAGRKVITVPFVFIICCVSIPTWVILFFQAGKSSILPPTAGVTVQQWGCCTQGTILPRAQVPGLVQELIHRASTPPDIIVDDYAKSQHLLRFALNPVQLQHLGFSSSLDPDRPIKDTAWSTAFENLQVEKLEKEHERMVSELYNNALG